MYTEEDIMQYVQSEEFFEDRAVIIQEGGYSTWAYVILEGKVILRKKTAKGIAKLATLEEGAIFGELVLFSKEREMARTASAIADGPVALGVLDGHRIVEDFGKLSPQMRKFISTLVKRLINATKTLVDLLPK